MGDAEDKSASHNADEYFLDRWSRRKLADHRGEPMDDPLSAPLAADSPQQEAATVDHADPSQQLTDAGMPSIDSLDSDSDYTVFMSPKVSEQLRTLALRKLFHLPAFNVTDGLNDYDEDYTQFAGLGNIVTHEMKRMLKRELDAEDVTEDETEDETEDMTRPVVLQETSEATAAGDIDSVKDIDEKSDRT